LQPGIFLSSPFRGMTTPNMNLAATGAGVIPYVPDCLLTILPAGLINVHRFGLRFLLPAGQGAVSPDG